MRQLSAAAYLEEHHFVHIGIHDSANITDESALQIANELSGILALSCSYSYMYKMPNMLLQKIVSHTALEIYYKCLITDFFIEVVLVYYHLL